MSQTQTMLETRWTLAECHVISEYAYERFILVEAWQIHLHLEVWRLWYYGMAPDQAVISLPGVRRVAVSGR